MKKQIVTILLLAGAMLTVTSCHTSSSPVPSSTTTSSFSVTFQGSTNNFTTGVATALQGDYSTGNPSILTFNTGNTTSIILLVQLYSSTAINALGVYKVSGRFSLNSTFSGGTATIADYSQGGTSYSIDANDTTSAATVTISNGTECKGTFNLRLNNGSGTYSTAAGTFDYIKP